MRESALSRMRDLWDRTQRAQMDVDNARYGRDFIAQSEFDRDQYCRVMADACARRDAAIRELEALIAPAEILAPRHPLVEAVATINPTFDTRLARARTN